MSASADCEAVNRVSLPYFFAASVSFFASSSVAFIVARTCRMASSNVVNVLVAAAPAAATDVVSVIVAAVPTAVIVVPSAPILSESLPPLLPNVSISARLCVRAPSNCPVSSVNAAATVPAEIAIQSLRSIAFDPQAVNPACASKAAQMRRPHFTPSFRKSAWLSLVLGIFSRSPRRSRSATSATASSTHHAT